MTKIIITDHKRDYLETLSEEKNLTTDKVYSLKEIKNCLFSISHETIPYLIEKENKSYSFIEEVLSYLPFLKDESCFKITYLQKLKKDLEEKGYFKENVLFKSFLKDKDIYLDEVKKEKEVKFFFPHIKKLEREEKLVNQEVYYFKSEEEEVLNFFETLSFNLEKDNNLKNYKVVIGDSKYMDLLDRFSIYYRIPLQRKESLIAKNIIKKYLEEVKLSKDIFKPFSLFKDKMDIKIKERLLTILNSMVYQNEYSFNTLYLILKEKLKRELLVSVEGLEVLTLNDNLRCQQNLFFLGFNSDNVPHQVINKGFLSDEELTLLKIDTSYDEAFKEEEILENILKSKKLYLSYTKKDKEVIPHFFSILNIKELTKEDDYKRHSLIFLSILYKKMYYNYLKYHEKSKNLQVLQNTLPDIYKEEYDNSYSEINTSLDLDLSYTSLNMYYECPFKFYLSYILNIKDTKETFDLKLGNFHHELLEHLDENIKEENLYEKIKTKYNFTPFEELIMTSLKEEIIFNLKKIREYEEETNLKSVKRENKFLLPLSKLNLNGKIDKILYNDRTYALIDYKTGSSDLNLDLLKYGLNMQLFIYLLLIQSDPLLKNLSFGGVYLEGLIMSRKNEKNKTFEELKEKSLKLKGLTIDDPNLIKEITDLNNSFIEGVKLKKNMELKETKALIKKETLNDNLSLVKDKIKEGETNILKRHFPIKPTVSNDKNKQIDSCRYCSFKSICYKKESDINLIDLKSEVDE